ncbi:Brp/Blh family beta-carotene 15,15'-dioxygenase [Flavobacterium sp.]|uniref:Brp/Blh family beta-carotene 15,15'-dioxygenase n=1 Tax=Flavobacterium sp. TaxID=239 RepID=UPI002FDB5D3E
MKDFTKFLIISSFLALWLNSFLTDEILNYIGFLLIFSFGILHGSNDLYLIMKSKSNKRPFIKVFGYYVIVVALGVVMFSFKPAIALLIFIIISGYHFGEQHLEFLNSENLRISEILLRLFYGLSILSLLFIFHIEEVQNIIYDLTQIEINKTVFNSFFWITLLMLCILCLIHLKTNPNFKKYVLHEITLFLIFSILFKSSSLIWGFSIYFILWHSIPSVRDQMQFLYGSINFENFKRYVKSAFLYWLVSVTGIVITLLFFQENQYFEAVFFSLLAAITFPHVWVILHMFKIKKAN